MVDFCFLPFYRVEREKARERKRRRRKEKKSFIKENKRRRRKRKLSKKRKSSYCRFRLFLIKLSFEVNTMKMDEMDIIYKNPQELVPYEKNTKRHDQKQINNVAQSIKDAGFVQPVVIDKNNVIVIGHCRTLAAIQLHMDKIPCVMKDDLSDEAIKRLRIIDNKTNESPWDFELLQEELESIDLSSYDVSFEFEGDIEDDQKEPPVVEDEPPEVDEEAEPTAKLGDVYKLGKHRLMCGDSTKPEDVEKLIGDSQIDLFLTDPPYNVNYHGSAGKIENDNMAKDQFREFLSSAFKNAYDHMRPGAAFYIWYASREQVNFELALNDANLFVRQQLIWNKNALILGRSDYQWKHEPCLYGWKDGAAHYFVDDRTQSTVIEDNQIQIDKMKKEEMAALLKKIFADKVSTTVINENKPAKSEEHPTMKPILLFARLVKNSSKQGENVLDLFGGSGTSIITCEQLNRKCFTMEYDPKFVDVIIKRWETFTGKKAVKL